MICDHEDGVYIQPISLGEEQPIAISCRQCQIIRLYNPKTNISVTAFSSSEYVPGQMCQGEGDTLLVVNTAAKNNPIFQLNCSRLPFKGHLKVIQTDMADLFSIYFVPFPYKLVVISGATDSSHIKAIDTETGKLAWEVRGKIDGEMCHPRGMLYVPQHEALLVADGKRCRVLALSPRDGSHLQTVQFGWTVGVVVHLSWHHYDILCHHITADKKEKVSLLTLSN